MTTFNIAMAKKYRDVFGSPLGKEVLKDIIEFAGFMETSFEKGDPYLSAFKEGKRNVALKIVHYLNEDLDTLSKMVLKLEVNNE